MADFVEMAAEARDRVKPTVNTHAGRGYLADTRRVAEAEAVSACAERLADYELDPPAEGKGVGRWGPVSIVPPLGVLIGSRRVSKLDPPTCDAAVRAVLAPVALGYVVVTLFETAPGSDGFNPRVDIPPEQLWRTWVARLNSDAVSASGLDDATRSGVNEKASELFQKYLAAAGLLPRVRKRMRYGALGQWYSEAGMILRLAQSAGPKGGDPVTDQIESDLDRWPFEPDAS